jgi:hypothetical protein
VSLSRVFIYKHIECTEPIAGGYRTRKVQVVLQVALATAVSTGFNLCFSYSFLWRYNREIVLQLPPFTSQASSISQRRYEEKDNSVHSSRAAK